MPSRNYQMLSKSYSLFLTTWLIVLSNKFLISWHKNKLPTQNSLKCGMDFGKLCPIDFNNDFILILSTISTYLTVS